MLPILHAPKTTNRGGGGRNRRHAVRFSPLYHAHHPTQQQKRSYIAQQKAGNSRSLTSFIFLLSGPSSGLFLRCPSSACVCICVCCAAKVVCLQFLLPFPALTQTRMRGRRLFWSLVFSSPLDPEPRSFLPSFLTLSLTLPLCEGGVPFFHPLLPPLRNNVRLAALPLPSPFVPLHARSRGRDRGRVSCCCWGRGAEEEESPAEARKKQTASPARRARGTPPRTAPPPPIPIHFWRQQRESLLRK